MKRVHRKNQRAKLPPNTKFVGRPSRWGNPFSVSDFGEVQVIFKYDNWLYGILKENPKFLVPLKGHDLACYCPLDQPCHADVLLNFINWAKIVEDYNRRFSEGKQIIMREFEVKAVCVPKAIRMLVKEEE